MPPTTLRGEENGRYKVMVVGNCGSGKTTVARRIGRALGIPCLSLDHIHWLPNWVVLSREETRAALSSFLAQNDQWVIDGNGLTTVGDLTLPNATDIIWLDPPLWRYFPRLFWRTMLRIFGLAEPCAPGCVETFHMAFFDAKESVLFYALKKHSVLRAKFRPYIGDPRWRRIAGSPESFLRRIEGHANK